MLFWFLGTAIVSVWFVFRDAQFDYRLLCVGALLPDIVDPWFGGARALHSMTVSIAALIMVVAASAGRKKWRKAALGLPIGMMLHLVYDGAFSNTRLFWWPIGGLQFRDEALPSAARAWIDIPLELIGIGALWWVWRTFGLGAKEQRERFVRTGRLGAPGAR